MRLSLVWNRCWKSIWIEYPCCRMPFTSRFFKISNKNRTQAELQLRIETFKLAKALVVRARSYRANKFYSRRPHRHPPGSILRFFRNFIVISALKPLRYHVMADLEALSRRSIRNMAVGRKEDALLPEAAPCLCRRGSYFVFMATTGAR